jgi:hypothetical protein
MVSPATLLHGGTHLHLMETQMETLYYSTPSQVLKLQPHTGGSMAVAKPLPNMMLGLCSTT